VRIAPNPPHTHARTPARRQTLSPLTTIHPHSLWCLLPA
jgi:hypothetical protein